MTTTDVNGPGQSPDQMQARIAELEAEVARLTASPDKMARDAGAASPLPPTPAPIGTWYMDFSTGVPVWDDALGDIFGIKGGRPVPREEHISMVHPDDREQVAQKMSAMLAGKSSAGYQVRYRFIRQSDNAVRWIDTRVHTLVRNGTMTHMSGTSEDITDDVLDKQELQSLLTRLAESETRRKQATKAGDVGTWTYDLETEKSDWDEVMLQLTGFETAPQRLAQSTAAIHPDDLAYVLENAAPLEAQGGPRSAVLRYRHIRPSDGRTIWVETHSEVVFDGDKRISVAGVLRDVTEQKLREDELKALNARLAESEDRLRRSAKAGGIGTWQLDFAAQTMVWDEVGRAIVGFPTLTPTVEEGYAACHPEDRDRVSEILDSSMSENGPTSLSFDFRYIRPDTGKTVWVASSSEVVFDAEKRVGLVGTVRDVTDAVIRKQELESLAARLLESEERRELAMEAGNVGIWQFDAASGTAIWDATSSFIFGLGEVEQTIEYATLESIIHPEDLVHHNALVADVLSKDTPSDLHIVYRANRVHDGAERWIDAKGRSIIVDGEAVGLIGTVRDITSEKESAEEIKLMNRELHHRVKNMFATILGMIRMSAREYPGCEDYVQSLSDRVNALSVAHLISMDRDNLAPVNLRQITEAIMAPYLTDSEDRIHITGPDYAISRKSVSNVGMILHELATNAVKYGALSPKGMRLDIELRRANDEPDAPITIVWRETCDITEPPKGGARRGFGSRLIASSARQLGGNYTPEWSKTGMKVILTVPAHEGGKP